MRKYLYIFYTGTRCIELDVWPGSKQRAVITRLKISPCIKTYFKFRRMTQKSTPQAVFIMIYHLTL